MLGAIYGDIVGSIYEYDQFKEIKEVDPERLILTDSFYSDDTIETVAVIDAILNSKDYEGTLRKYISENLNYTPVFSPYFKNAFSPNTIKWANGLTSENSNGNGAMMRISPVGYLFDNEDAIRKMLLMGGDTDTNCCIVGAVAESLYGIDDRRKNDVMKKLPFEYPKILKRAYKSQKV